MYFDSIKLPRQLTEPVTKFFVTFFVILIITILIMEFFIPKNLPSLLRQLIGFGIIGILAYIAYKFWLYIPAIF
ncbi:hypothetical protein B4079_4389 [Bacillus cereus]|uniref:Uncharacterized protein n=1 Tax=Bacillus cereus HuB4-4 TaxID=1053211 RepID=A0A9W5QZC5_BACCE|nr:hypothetical protein IGM_00479 [Bacillus cereus HuB4-4]KYQ00471.1 hypothetical protein B4079_4389 [Bacillus cereus]PFO44941.1 hypothetical protein COJ71_27175 [Bacillus cereus]PGR19009.1 hypothetical protein COC50_23385 [Bacillus anthracis]